MPPSTTYSIPTPVSHGNLVWPIWASQTSSTATILSHNEDQIGIYNRTSNQSSTPAGVIWGQWVIHESHPIESVLTAGPDETWYRWNGTVHLSWDDQGQIQVVQSTVATPEQQEEWRRQSEERRAKRQKAEQTARQLLEAHLTEEERAEFYEKDSFHVTTPSGRRYLITKSRMGNVYEIVGERRVSKLCIHPRDMVPDYDTMLAQKLMLLTDEEEFRRVANNHWAGMQIA